LIGLFFFCSLEQAKVEFKQKLKVVIIKVLGEHGIHAKDPLFRTCANKLSVRVQ